MGLFGKKKKETISEDSEEYVLKEELEEEVEKIQTEFRVKQTDLDELVQKIENVKGEYDTTVTNLMAVKKELNKKKMELDVVQREYRDIREKIKDSEQIKDSKSITEFNRTEKNLSKIKDDLEETTAEYKNIKDQITQEQVTLHGIKQHQTLVDEYNSTREQATLHGIKQQQIEYQKELDEANARLYNAKEELAKKDQFQETDVLSPKERELIQGTNSQNSSAGVIEAASAVVGSLKSKLNMSQKEIEAVQLLLETERKEHEQTKLELERLKNSIKS